MLSDEEKEVLLGFLIGSISILRDMNIQFTEKSRNKLADKIMELIKAYEKENQEIESLKEKIKTFKIEDVKIFLQFGEIAEKKRWQDKIKAKIEELEIEQESNREDLKIAIDNLLFQNIDKIGNRISVNMSVREILQSLLEKE